MIRQKIDASAEKQIILYSIISTPYLTAIRRLAKRELFRSPYAQTVWGWIAEYFDEFQVAPEKDIQSLYIAHKLEIDDDKEEEVIASFLQSLSDSDDTISNVDYAIKQAEKWLNIRALELVKDNISEALARKDIQEAQNAIATYRTLGTHIEKGVNILSDVDVAMDAFTNEEEILFSFPGAVGVVIGDCCRTDFVSFLGFSKSGKSWYLLESAKEALYQGNKVLYISLEMPQRQMLRRIWRSMAKRPRRTRHVRIPFFVESDVSTRESPLFDIEYDEKEIEGFSPSNDWFETWMKKFNAYFHGGGFRIVSMPARSVTVHDIEVYVSNLEFYNKWIPNVIVIDYADLISSKLKGEFRHQLDDIWANLRRVALERNICIITASQSGRASSKGESTIDTISEDIRKISHVTKMIGINATKEEKAKGIHRISQLAERDDSSCFEQAVVLSCLDLGQICIDSRFASEVVMNESK